MKVDGVASSRKPQQGRLQVCLPRRCREKVKKVKVEGAASSGKRKGTVAEVATNAWRDSNP